MMVTVVEEIMMKMIVEERMMYRFYKMMMV